MTDGPYHPDAGEREALSSIVSAMRQESLPFLLTDPDARWARGMVEWAERIETAFDLAA